MIKTFVVNPLLYENTSPCKYSQVLSLFISNKLSLIKSLILSKTSKCLQVLKTNMKWIKIREDESINNTVDPVYSERVGAAKSVH